MSRIGLNEFEEYDEFDDENISNVEANLFGKGLLLPSQTRNPHFGIFPSLKDDDCVIRYPEYAKNIGCPLKNHLNPEVSRVYEAFRSMAFNEIYLSGRNGQISDEALRNRFNNSMRKGKFRYKMREILDVPDKVLKKYLHPTTYTAVLEFWSK
ncbi:hypothetical protein COU54_02380 [Candidatus Pacearchaeota archaeon CG10_big_fil_rev_8_21_14_0_10_31_24]|nr:MAG: hypothetical protein COU54_02380 [Candidatus Pacearchaeota archaeon CG10_big_fil_rev_8_21_14_0_10_31_24]